MKLGKLWLTFVALAALTLLVGIVAVSARSSQPPRPPSPHSLPVSSSSQSSLPPQDMSPSPSAYLLALPMEQQLSQEIPPDLTPEQATDYAYHLLYRQAQPILTELERLRAEGKIAGFQVRPDLHAIAVQGVQTEGWEALAYLSGIAGVYSADAPPPCLAATSKAMSQQVLGMSRVVADLATHQHAATDLTTQATDPSISIYPSGSPWIQSSFSGHTTPVVTVTMRILRGGQVIATDSTVSDSSGYYSFYPSWQNCPSLGYEWTVRSGDVVEVTANGHTASTVVADISAWVDPTANVVAGETDPGRSVEVMLNAYGMDPCSSTLYTQTVGTDGGGNFNADFNSQVDFDRRAFATIYAYDANGNDTHTSFGAYRFSAEFGSGSFGGYLKPGTNFTATLSRGDTAISKYSGTSGVGGYYWGYFTYTIRPGDMIQVSGGDVTIQYTATDLNATLNPATDQITGTTGSGRLVKAYTYKRTWGSVWTSCVGNRTCITTTADGSGFFTLNAGQDIERGDYANFYVYDAEGNYQYRYDWPAPAIIADLTGTEVEGFWSNPDAGSVTVTLKSGSTVKATHVGVSVDLWDGSFSTWMSNLFPGDTIEVTDGTITETMTVQDFTARLYGSTDHLTGQAYDDHVIANLWDFRRDGGYWLSSCTETDVTNGTYDISFTDIEAGGQDYAEVWNTGPDGHYTHREAHAFTINAEMGSSHLWGYSGIPQIPMTITFQRNGNPVAVYTATSSSSGYYYNAYLSSGTPVTITSGDIIYVEAGDGNYGSLPIPELTMNVDAANNRIYGIAPANEPIQVGVGRHSNDYYYPIAIQIVQADSSGHYNADFNGLWWHSWYYGCASVDVGHRCSQPFIYYYNPDEYMLTLVGDPPSPVEADTYESDDTAATAAAYTGVQFHTFHTVTDTDWVAFTVSAEDVSLNVPYRIETFDLGWSMATKMALYDTDGTSLLYEWTNYGNRAAILWTPTSAGTYYLNISPPSSYYAAHCDAVYSLKVLPVRAQIYMPLVVKGY